MYPLFESPKLDRELKTLIRENFREFCSGPPQNDANCFPLEIANQFHCGDEARLHMIPHNSFGNEIDRPAFNRMDSLSDNETDAKFSDEEDEKEITIKSEETDDDDDLPLSKVKFDYCAFDNLKRNKTKINLFHSFVVLFLSHNNN